MKIIDKTNVNDPTNREGLWAAKLKSLVPNDLNLKDFCNILKFLVSCFYISRTFTACKI